MRWEMCSAQCFACSNFGKLLAIVNARRRQASIKEDARRSLSLGRRTLLNQTAPRRSVGLIAASGRCGQVSTSNPSVLQRVTLSLASRHVVLPKEFVALRTALP